jgi:DNA-binding CsgD family transcriptional regulator/5-methylcytosine-specific restriction endonuclease McrA
MFVFRAAHSIPASEKRRRVNELRARGLSYVAIARELGLTKSTVAYHVRQGTSKVNDKAARRYDWVAIQAAIDADSLSMRQAMARFGFSRDSWGKAVKRGVLKPVDRFVPLEKILIEESPTDRRQVKRRLLAAGLKATTCEACGISDWSGAPLSLQLHHINGDGRDNRIENLELLCPNCHSQTDTFAGRNRGRGRRLGVAGQKEGSGEIA